jgi:hypothetical protein
MVMVSWCFAACGEDPSAPSVSLSAPAISSPAQAAVVSVAQPVLEVQNVTVSGSPSSPPTYRFELSESQSLTPLAASVEGVAQGTGTTSWRVSSPLATDSVFYWRARASAAGTDGPWSATASFRTGFGVFNRSGSNMVVIDPLTSGASVGEVSGGAFVSGGWQPGAASNYIRYDVEAIETGFVEFQLTNLTRLNPRRDTKQLLSMWDPTRGDLTENPFRVTVQKDGPGDFIRLRFITQGQQRDDKQRAPGWDPAHLYKFRVEWDGSSARVLIDDQERLSINYTRRYLPARHYIELGAASRAETLEGAIYSNVRIGRTQ